ncbi:MAG: ABC transporter ATP-binding protein, partial [Firmicutes bacterium]|nr:ABC transporter ATP-binding protein [Bacillota bacterium]
MIKKLQIKLQKKFALSEKGSKDLIKGCLFCALQNISFMLPVGILFKLVCELKDGGIQNISFYIISCTAALIFIAAATWFQYNSTFFATYIESGVRRITLAERLRKLPLSFFGKKDLADLTNTIMADCTTLETAFSHYICSLAGSFISTAIIGISLFSVNVSMAIAALWVLPISFAIVYFSGDVQDKFNNLSMQAKTDCADGIQECIETVRDLKANNAEEKYLSGLNEKIDNVEKSAFASELATGVFVVSAQLILKFGIATTALTGAVLYKNGSLDMITFFMYLLVVSRLYDPMQATLTNLAAVISLRVNISRMNEILYHPVQTGSETLDNNGTDIVFENVSFSYDDGEKVLENISFTAKQGEVTALVGPSGGGKTTVSRLAARFYDITEGRITVGGVDISTVDPEKLLSLYSIVFQNVLLFNNTVLENIRIGRLGASDEEVIA